MNKLEKIFDDISEQELVVLLKELEIYKRFGSLPEKAKLRKLIETIMIETGNTFSVEVIGVCYKILEKAAYKWLYSNN